MIHDVTMKRSSSPISEEEGDTSLFKRSRCDEDVGDDVEADQIESSHENKVATTSNDQQQLQNDHNEINRPIPEQEHESLSHSESENVATMITSVKIESCHRQEESPKAVTPDLDTMYQTKLARGNLVMGGPKGEERWRAHRMAEDYISLAGDMMLPGTHLGPFGYDPAQGKYPIERITAYGVLTSPLRKPSVIEKWSPYEIATFEAAVAIFGKQFNTVQKLIRSKSTKDIVEFYYIWKKTHHYKMWKKQYIPPDMDLGDSDED